MNPCAYCEAPYVFLDGDWDIAHRPDCPSVTNLWPVRPQDVEPHGFCCVTCAEPFAVGDHYTERPSEDEHGHTDDATFEVTCLSCAVAAS